LYGAREPNRSPSNGLGDDEEDASQAQQNGTQPARTVEPGDEGEVTDEGEESAPPDDDESEDGFVVRLERPFPEGARFSITLEQDVRVHVRLDHPDMGTRENEKTISMDLDAAAEVTAAGEDDVPQEIELQIDTLTMTEEGDVDSLLPSGTEVLADLTGSEPSFESDETLGDDAREALKAALPSGTGTRQELVLSPEDRQSVGGSWSVGRDALGRHMAASGLDISSADRARMQGKLLGRTELHGAPALRVRLDGEFAGIEPEDFQGTIDQSTFQFDSEMRIPEDPQRPVAQHVTGTLRGELQFAVGDVITQTQMEASHELEYRGVE
jgi:hypothetical protein